MQWLQVIFCFLAGLFSANTIPHLVKGVCGDRFPTPFAKPPGKGLSSPLVNVLWSLLNLMIAYCFFRAGNLAGGDRIGLAIFFSGFSALSIMMSLTFAKKHAS